MYTIYHYKRYRTDLDALRNDLKFCINCGVATFRFVQGAKELLKNIDKKHEACNKKIGELTE